MSTPDSATLLVLMVAAALLMLGVTRQWRHLVYPNSEIPVWKFLSRRGVAPADVEARIGARAALHAQLRCATCSARRDCVQRLAAGASTPVDGCPNRSLGELAQHRYEH
jgi:hypothetical protein